MLQASEVVCPDKWEAFANISLPGNKIAERINELAENLYSQLQDKEMDLAAFSTAIDESTDVNDASQLAVFIDG
ncbi:GTF2I repeat domain containing 2, partial [Chelydra serpentina]